MKKKRIFVIILVIIAANVAYAFISRKIKESNQEDQKEQSTVFNVEIPYVSDFTCDYYDDKGKVILDKSTVFEPDDEINVKINFSLSNDAFNAGKNKFTLKFAPTDGFDGKILSANSSSTSDKNFTATYSVDDRNAKQCEIEARINVRYSSGSLIVSYSYDDEEFSDALTLPLNNDKTLSFTYDESADGYVVAKDTNNCEWLKQVKNLNFPDSFADKPIVAIAEETFSDCGNLINIKLPNGVVSISDSAFMDCKSLTSIKIPDSVTNIGGYAFYNCTGLKNVEIFDSITDIGYYAFSGCDSLQYNEYGNSYYLGNENNLFVVCVKVKSDATNNECNLRR